MPSAPSPHRPATTQPSQLRGRGSEAACCNPPPTQPGPRVSKPSSVGGDGDRGSAGWGWGGGGVGAGVSIRQVRVWVCECVCVRGREIASAYVLLGGLQMCLWTWQGEPGERR